MSDAIGQLIELNDPVGETIRNDQEGKWITIESKRVPIGVIGMIYEARPNVTIDAATFH